MTLRINDNGTDRDMTADEQAAYKNWQTVAQAEAAAQAQAEADKADARANAIAKLTGLGLTADEIAALLGA